MKAHEYTAQRSATMMHKSASDNSLKEAFYGDLPKSMFSVISGSMKTDVVLELEGPAAPEPEYGGLPLLSGGTSSNHFIH